MDATPLAATARSQIVEILVEAAHPTKIILFGSHARSERQMDSDVDLVVVEREVPSRYEEMVRLTRALTPLRMPIDVLVYSEADVAEKGEWLGTALRSAMLEGEVLYAAR
jgi:predicted nucleotidyltransferase